MVRGLALFALVVAAADCGGKTDDPPVSTYVIGTNEGDPNDPSSGRDPVEDGGTLTVSEGGTLTTCGGKVTAFSTDFESGNIADHFTVFEPAAFTTTSTNAIDGQHSLSINADSKAYLSHALPNVCQVTLSFTVQLSSQIVGTGLKLVEVNAQRHFFALIVDPHGSARIVQTQGGTVLISDQFATIAAETPTHITFAVDVSGKSAIATIAGTVSPNAYFTSGSEAVAIDEIDFGASPDLAAPSPVPSGTWLLDDVSVQ